VRTYIVAESLTSPQVTLSQAIGSHVRQVWSHQLPNHQPPL